MRTPTLQYLYLQKPITMIILICIISVLPWLGLSELGSTANSADAAVAEAMLRSGEIHLATARSAGIHCHDGFGVDLLRPESEIP